jgi:hypothetical protein
MSRACNVTDKDVRDLVGLEIFNGSMARGEVSRLED